MPFVEDLAPFFEETEHGTAALYDGATDPIFGIFDRAYLEAIGNFAEGTGPVYVCAAASVPGVAHSKALIISGTTYLVRGVEPDGTGVVLLRLEEQ